MGKKEVSEFETARRKRRAKFTFQKIKKLLGALLIFIFIVAAIWLCAKNDVAGILGDKLAGMSSGNGKMQVELAGNSVVSTFDCGGNMGVLTDGTLNLYAPNGKNLLTFAHDMVNPVAKAAGRRILLFDQGGTKLIVRTRNKILFEKNFEYTIINADISGDGWLTVITTAQRYTSKLYVWDADYDGEIWTWSASEEYAVLAAANASKKTVAAVTVTASETGEIITNVHVFTTESAVELGKTMFSDTAPLDIAFDSRGDIKLVCDSFAAALDKEARILGRYDFTGNLVSCVNADGKDGISLIFDRFTEARATDIAFLGENCAELAKIAVSGKYISADGDGEKTALYCSGELSVFDRNGKRSAFYDSEQDAIRVELCGNSVYAVTRDELCTIS